MKGNRTDRNDALLGILMLETTFPRIVGDIGNPRTFSFPVLYDVVHGASPERVVIKRDRSLIEPFVEAGRKLIDRGVRMLSTSCGFLALFHQELCESFDVPVYSSSLLQIPLACSVIAPGRKVGVLTARAASLTDHHFAAVGADADSCVVAGMDDAQEFTSVFIQGKRTLNEEQCRREIQHAAERLIRENPDTGAVVLECTNMPPYRSVVQQAVGGLPVFDIVTLLQYAHSTQHGAYVH